MYRKCLMIHDRTNWQTKNRNKLPFIKVISQKAFIQTLPSVALTEMFTDYFF